MLIELFKGLWFVLFGARVKRSFSALLVFWLWLLLAIALFVTIPHSFEVIVHFEHGELANPKSLALAIIVEMTAAVFFLLTLHSKEISPAEKKAVLWMTVPYIFITARLQLSYFYSTVAWLQITPLELGLILPYVITSVTVCIGIMWVYVGSAKVTEARPPRQGITFFGFQIWQATNLTIYQQRIAELETELHHALAAPDEEKESLRQQLETAQARLEAPDPYREILSAETQRLREQLTDVSAAHQAAAHAREEALALVGQLREEADGLHEEVGQLRETTAKLPEIKLIYRQNTFPKEQITALMGRLYSNKNRLNKEEVTLALEQIWSGEPEPTSEGA